MPSTIVSLLMVFAIGIIAISLALEIGMPILDTAKSSSDYTEAELALKKIDNSILETAREGSGSVRELAIASPMKFMSMASENAITSFGGTYSSLFDYNTRTKSGDIILITGSDANCFEGVEKGSPALIAQNSLVRFAFNFTKKNETNYTALDTATAIISMTDVARNVSIDIVNSSVVIGTDERSSRGSGYSELLSSGHGLAFCTIHFYVNSTVQYDIYYRLYSGADFIQAEVRNIR